MKIAICDDAKDELKRILDLLEQYRKMTGRTLFVRSFESSTELASLTEKEHYDLYLLDILMPVLSGMELAREIRSFDKAADIIFLTSSPEFAVESYTVKASNYLVKPIHEAAFFVALDDIFAARKDDEGRALVVKSNIGVHKLLLSDLIYVEAINRKVIYYLKNGEELACADRFSSVCEGLSGCPEFLLVHRSFLVNMNYIRTIETADLILHNGKRIPLAQRRVTEIKKHYLAFQMEELT